MSELKVGTIALVHGLIYDRSSNGKCVTLLKCIPPASNGNDILKFICPVSGSVEEFLMDYNYWWLCDDGFFYLPKNLLPIGDKDKELVKDKENDFEH